MDTLAVNNLAVLHHDCIRGFDGLGEKKVLLILNNGYISGGQAGAWAAWKHIKGY